MAVWDISGRAVPYQAAVQASCSSFEEGWCSGRKSSSDCQDIALEEKEPLYLGFRSFKLCECCGSSTKAALASIMQQVGAAAILVLGI